MSMFRSLAQMGLSGIFIIEGANAFVTPGGRVKTVEKAGIPQPKQSVELNGAAMVIGGFMLALNIAPRLASALLIASLVPTTLIGHAFWNEKEPQGYRMQRIHFLKNLGLIGGLLLVLSGKNK
jgi:putative oxidoreductase